MLSAENNGILLQNGMIFSGNPDFVTVFEQLNGMRKVVTPFYRSLFLDSDKKKENGLRYRKASDTAFRQYPSI